MYNAQGLAPDILVDSLFYPQYFSLEKTENKNPNLILSISLLELPCKIPHTGWLQQQKLNFLTILEDIQDQEPAGMVSREASLPGLQVTPPSCFVFTWPLLCKRIPDVSSS